MKLNKIIIVLLSLIIIFSLYSYSNRPLTFTGYAGSVPVQIGYEKSSEFWVLSANIGWTKDTAILVKMPSGSVDNGATTQKNVELVIKPTGSYETASLTKGQLIFSTTSLGTTETQDYYQVEGANWITTTTYDVSLNGISQLVKVGMNYPSTVNLGQGAFINNLGILSNGANAPSGDFVLIYNPDNGYWEFYRYDDVYQAGLYWERNHPFKLNGYFDTPFTWYDVWQFLKINNRLPVKPVMTASSYTFNPTTSGSYGNIQMNYDKVAFSSEISVYIPKALADTIILQIGASKAVITGKTDFKVSEGSTSSFSVTVRNDGGEDYVTVKATSPYYTINPVTKFMKKGEVSVFYMTAYALQIDGGDKDNLPVYITADGTDPYNGDTTTTVYGTTYDTPIGVSSWKLTVIPKNPDGSVISNAEVFINNEKVFIGQNFVMKPRGDYTVSGGVVSGYYTPTPISVSMIDSDITVILQYSIGKPSDINNDFWDFLKNLGVMIWLIGFVVLLVLFIILNKMINGGRYLTNKNIKESVLLSIGVLVTYYMYLQYLLIINTLGWTIWIAVGLTIGVLFFIKLYDRFNFIGLKITLIIGVIIFMMVVSIMMSMKDAMCDTPLSFMFKSCNTDIWKVLFK